jgi:hypothetical protein
VVVHTAKMETCGTLSMNSPWHGSQRRVACSFVLLLVVFEQHLAVCAADGCCVVHTLVV